jgi:threonine aldolase
MSKVWRGFASDNYAAAHPAVLQAMVDVNEGHQVAYGEDDSTKQLSVLIKQHFGESAEVFPVFNGTGSNVAALSALMERWEAVICASSAHINMDEGGAPEKVAGLKLWTVPTPDGKLTPELIESQAYGFGDVHRSQPKVVSITQSSEYGTVYSVSEIKAITDFAHKHGMFVHLDGARISNAAASLNLPFRAFTTDVGVDVVSFGGTKNGAIAAEAVIALNPRVAEALPFIRKSYMQLASKMRFSSAQLVALLSNDLWLQNAKHSNQMAQLLFKEVSAIPGVTVTKPVQANAVFAILPPEVTERLQKRFRFYVWDPATGEVRWMCSWDTTEDDIQSFSSAIAEEMAKG